MTTVTLARDYELVRPLGKGGMAEVFLARQSGIDGFEKLVVVKRILAHLARDRRFVRMFLDEARTAADLRHPNVISVLEVGQHGGEMFMVLEYLEGRNLREVTRAMEDAGEKLPLGFALHIVLDAARGLNYAHEKTDLYGRPLSIVHRDVSPHNVFVTYDGVTKVLDFGIASAALRTEDYTKPGEVWGKLSFMSPEQAVGEDLTSAADQFSLGVILYELTTGRRPFEWDNDEEAIAALDAAEFPKPSKLVKDYPPELERIVLRALKRNPAERFERCADLAVALEDVLAASSIPHSPARMGAFIQGLFDEDATQDTPLPTPSSLRQLVGDAPTVAGGQKHKTNLVAPPSSFVGRHTDLQKLDRYLLSGERLVSILGPGGMGKTHLAQYYGVLHQDEYAAAGGVWFCDLTEAGSIDAVCGAVASPLGVPANSAEQVGHVIAGRGRILLILDNFEQVVEHGPDTIGRWLEMAPDARFIVTSREQLKLRGEAAYELPGLSLPADVEEIHFSEAVQLFIARAMAVNRAYEATEADLPTIGTLVTHLDGLPLAIELAAARITAFTPEQLLDRIGKRLDLLAGARRDVSERQATLRGAIDWSWNLLSDWEKDALAQCSVFRGGFSLRAAEAVLDLSAHKEAPWIPDVLQTLREKSLLRGQDRYAMLESIRDYAAEKLDGDAVGARHTAYYLKMASELVPKVRTHGGNERLRQLALERENLFAVYDRARDHDAPSETLAALLALDPVLYAHGPFATHSRLLDEALDNVDGVDDEMYANALLARGVAWRDRGRMEESEADFAKAQVIGERLDDARLRALAIRGQASLMWARGDLDAAFDRGKEALEVAEGKSREAEARCLTTLGNVLLDHGKLSEAREYHQRALTATRAVGDLHTESAVLVNLANGDLSRGRLEPARESLVRALEISRALHTRRMEAFITANLGILLQEEGNLDRSHRTLEAALGILREAGDQRFTGVFMGILSTVLHEIGDLTAATQRCDEALRLVRAVNDKRYVGCNLTHLAALRATAGRAAEGREALAEGRALLEEVGDPLLLATAELHEGMLEVAEGHPDAARTRIEVARTKFAGEAYEVRTAIRLLQRALSAAGE